MNDPFEIFEGDRRRNIRPVLVEGATLLTMTAAAADLECGDILITDGIISAIGSKLRHNDADVIDARGKIAIPGFHDTHRHSWEGQLRRIIPSGDIDDYSCTTHGEFAQHYDPEDVYAGTLLTALHALSSGITSILDYSHNSQSAEHCRAAIAALDDSGIRGVFACSAPSILGKAKSSCVWPDVIADLAQQHFRDTDGRLTIRVAGTPSTLFANFFELADQLGIGVSIDAVAGDRASAWILDADRNGWLGPTRTLIHCTGLSDDAWHVIAKTGSTVSLCPHADMQYVIGQPPLRQALAVGIRPSISVDDDMGLSSDMWTQMRLLSASYRQDFGVFLRGADPDRQQARALTAFDLLDFATARGAVANGLAHRCGTLEVGLAADIVLIDAEDLNTMPLNNAYGSVVHAADTSSVSTVIVDGIVRKRDGKLVGVDLDALRTLVVRSRDKLLERVGIEFPVLSRQA